MDARFPARLHAILARRAPLAAVFRRGPSRAVATLLWDRRDDSFRMGQWLRGVIYVRRCDLSPDGRHMICFAANHRWGAEPTMGTWTAVSRTPWLKALDLWGKGDSWNGGGWFLNDRDYWLNGCHRPLRQSREVRRVEADPIGRQHNNECLGPYFPRLRRDGWQQVAVTPWQGDFVRDLAHGWRLHKLAHAGPPQQGKGVYWDEHLLECPRTGEIQAHPGWEWAERCGNTVVYAEGGCLWRQAIETPERLEQPRLLRDFNDMAFEAIAAPY